VLPTTALKRAIETAERLRKVVEESKVIAEDNSLVELTISLGVSSLKPGDSLDGLVYRADNALYIAKQEGRNQVQFID
jgi:diguanylate cyclase